MDGCFCFIVSIGCAVGGCSVYVGGRAWKSVYSSPFVFLEGNGNGNGNRRGGGGPDKGRKMTWMSVPFCVAADDDQQLRRVSVC